MHGRPMSGLRVPVPAPRGSGTGSTWAYVSPVLLWSCCGSSTLAIGAWLRWRQRQLSSSCCCCAQRCSQASAIVWGDPLAKTAASAAQAEILRAAWATDPELAAFEGSLRAQPHCSLTADGLLQQHGAWAWAENDGDGCGHRGPRGARRRWRQRPGVLLVHTAVGPQDMYLRWRAHALATRGYVVLVADLLGDASGAAWDASWGRQARSVYEGTEGRALLVQRVRGALAELGAHPLVDSHHSAWPRWATVLVRAAA
eukprot:SAG25_NODE_725_length_5716_cov_7.434752_1_plen_256_part_00